MNDLTTTDDKRTTETLTMLCKVQESANMAIISADNTIDSTEKWLESLRKQYKTTKNGRTN